MKNPTAIMVNVSSSQPYSGPGVYSIHNCASKTVIDLANGGKPVTGPPIQGYSSGDQAHITNSNQLWLIADIGKDTCLIINYESGDFLSAQNGPDGLCTAQADQPDNKSVHWKIEIVEDAVMIRSVLYPGSVIDLDDGSTMNGATVQVWSENLCSMQNQLWYLQRYNHT